MIGCAFSGNEGTYSWIGASRSRRPSSTSLATAAAVSDFEMLPTRNFTDGCIGTRCSRFA